MSKRTKQIAILLTLIVAIAVVWLLAYDGNEDDTPRGQARTASMQDMAGMDMSGDGTVQLTPQQIRTFGVTFGTVEERVLHDEVRTVGIVSFDERRLTSVTPRFSGYVERLHVDFTGQAVRRGQPLADVYSPELVAAQEELLLAARLQRNLPESAVPGVPSGSSDLVAAAAQRLRLWDISSEQIEDILESGRVRRTLTLYAPVSGIIVDKNVLQGQAIQAGQSLYTIADLSEVWIEAELRESDAALVQEGDTATIAIAALPDQPIRGRIEYVYPTLQPESRTLEARIAVPNPDLRLKPGMYATVRVSAAARAALTVPSSAILNTGERRIVFVDMGDGRMMPHDVRTGRVAGDYTEVLAGLEPGQRVVTSAQFLLDSESNLADVMRSMMSQMNMSDMGATGAEGSTPEGEMEGMEGMPMSRPER